MELPLIGTLGVVARAKRLGIIERARPVIQQLLDILPGLKAGDSYGVPSVLRDRFGGFLGRVPNCAARTSTGVTFRLPGGRSVGPLNFSGAGTAPQGVIAPRAIFPGLKAEAYRAMVKAAVREWCEHKEDRSFLWSDKRAIEAGRAMARLGSDIELPQEEQDFLGPIDREAMLAELEDLDTSHERRALIGVRLAILGDGRQGVGLRDGLPDIAWCEVPGGEVELEVDYSEERSRFRRVMKTLRAKSHFTVEPFAIARYPVTYAQYRAFVEAEDGYRNEQWWEGLYYDPEPGRQFMQRDNHPADNVSCYDAMAFCRWLSARLGEEVRLPTEWEWQQAATGGDPSHEYPWGPEWDGRRANTYESGLSQSTAVGMYPGGVSHRTCWTSRALFGSGA